MGLKDAALMTALKEPGEAATVIPIQIIVESGGPLVPNSIPANQAQIPTTGGNP